MDKLYYFDNAATTYPKPYAVVEAMQRAIGQGCFNAGRGSYEMSARAYEDTKLLREKLLNEAGSAVGGEAILAPGATVAFNMLLGGLHLSKESVVYVSPFEHNAVMRVLYAKQQHIPFEIRQLPVDKSRLMLDLERTDYEFCRKKPDLVCMTHISNVTGYILPVKEVCTMAKKYNQAAITVCDGCQAMGLISRPLYRNEMVDYYVFAGHKTLYGPFGIGGIICNSPYSVSLLKDKDKYTPYICGGTGSDSLNMEMSRASAEMLEAGSMNILAVKGLIAALSEESFDSFEKEKDITEMLVKGLEKIPGVRLYLPGDLSCHIGIVSFNIEGYQSSEAGEILNDDYHISVRTGYHCAPLIHQYLGDSGFHGTVRASVGRYTSPEDIEYFIRAVQEITQDC